MLMDLNSKTVIIEYLESTIATLAPNAKTREMYGGTVIDTVGGDPKTCIGGFFVYDKHISVEFSNGYLLEDPDGLLEGRGKKRRHLKLRRSEEIITKRLDNFIKQALTI